MILSYVGTTGRIMSHTPCRSENGLSRVMWNTNFCKLVLPGKKKKKPYTSSFIYIKKKKNLQAEYNSIHLLIGLKISKQNSA